MMLILKIRPEIQLRRHMHSNTRIQILKDAFGLTVDEASKVLRNVNETNSDAFLYAIKMCRKLGFKDEEILLNPKILSKNAIQMEHEYMVFEEGGFKKITPHILTQYWSLNRKKVIELKLTNYLPHKLNVAESFSKYLDPKPDDGVVNFNQFKDDHRWRDIQCSILKLYLGWRLQATQQEIHKLFRIHPTVKYKSIRLVCENIRIALEVGLNLRRIKTSGYLLHGYPEHTKEVLRDYSNIAGGDLKKAVIGCPKLLTVTPEKYARTYGLLKKHEIPDDTIRNNLNVFQYAPQTIQYRLEEIDRSPELKTLKHHNKFLSLVVHHQRAKSRMCYLSELKMKCLPLKLLASRNRIDKHVLSGMDVNDSKEVVMFLKAILKCNDKHLEKQLKKHPHYCAVPLYQMEDTLNYLKEIEFTTDAISRVVSILLYPKDAIKDTLESIRSDSIFNDAENQCGILNLLLYNLEKKFDFTGKGIWPHPVEDENDKNE